MTKNGFILKFQGFQPSDFTHSFLYNKMDLLSEEAPYGSILNAVFTRQDQLFKGVVTIYSSSGRFFAMATGTKVKEVSRRLVEQMRKQLSKWKQKRFQKFQKYHANERPQPSPT